jgi:hypothetical protein
MRKWLQESTDKKLTIKTTTNYQRKIVHHFVRKESNGFVSTERNKDGNITMFRMTEEEKKKYYIEKNDSSEVMSSDRFALNILSCSTFS